MFQFDQSPPLDLPSGAYGQPNYYLTASTPRQDLQSSSWKMTFRDEFNASDLNKNKWHTSATNRNQQGSVYQYRDRFHAYFDDRNVHVFNGNLLVDSQPAPKNGKLWTGGWASTQGNFSQKYGYFEVRAKFDPSNGTDSGAWLFPDDASWPPEIDIVEAPGDYAGKAVGTNVHWSDNGKDASNWVTTHIDSTQFHVYGVLWEPGKVMHLIDGKVVSTTTDHVPDKAMYINLATEISGIAGVNDKFFGDPTQGRAVSQEYDYVRVWSHD